MIKNLDRVPHSKETLEVQYPEIFERYRVCYESLPSHKKVLASLIKYSQMYQPIRHGSRYVDPFRRLAGINEERKLRRVQVDLHKRDLIQTYDEKWGRKIVVTSRGHKIFYEDYPLAILRQKPWDGYWTIVMYDFPEKERGVRKWLRARLMDLGFGCPQISILVSPLPVEEPVQQFLEGEEVADKVWTLRAKRILGMSNQEVVAKAWPVLGEINQLYSELLRVLPEVKDKQELVTQWKNLFVAVNSADPYLPLALCPEDWQGEACEKAFLKLGPLGFVEALLKKGR